MLGSPRLQMTPTSLLPAQVSAVSSVKCCTAPALHAGLPPRASAAAQAQTLQQRKQVQHLKPACTGLFVGKKHEFSPVSRLVRMVAARKGSVCNCIDCSCDGPNAEATTLELLVPASAAVLLCLPTVAGSSNNRGQSKQRSCLRESCQCCNHSCAPALTP